MANWADFYKQGGAYSEASRVQQKKARRKKWTYTVKRNDNLWRIAKNYGVSPASILKKNKIRKVRPGQTLNIYQDIETPEDNQFNAAQSAAAQRYQGLANRYRAGSPSRMDRRDKRWYNPQGQGGIRRDWYGTITDPEGNVLYSSVQPRTGGRAPGYQDYRLNWFAEQGILPLTVNTWVADQLGYTDLLKEFGYRLNSELDRWERPQIFPFETGAKKSGGGGYGYGGGGYGGGGGRRGGGGGGEQPAGYTGFAGTPAAGMSGYRGTQPMYGGRAYTQSGRQYAPVGLITWRI